MPGSEKVTLYGFPGPLPTTLLVATAMRACATARRRRCRIGGRNFLLVGKVCNTGFYSGEAVPHRYIFQCLVWRGQQEGDKDCYECHNPSSQYQSGFLADTAR